MGEYLTPQEARHIDLSLNPFKRHRQAREYIGQLGLAEHLLEPFDPLLFMMGRTMLVNAAITRQHIDTVNNQIQE